MTSYRHNGAMRGASGAETAAHIEGWYEGEPLTPGEVRIREHQERVQKYLTRTEGPQPDHRKYTRRKGNWGGARKGTGGDRKTIKRDVCTLMSKVRDNGGRMSKVDLRLEWKIGDRRRRYIIHVAITEGQLTRDGSSLIIVG